MLLTTNQFAARLSPKRSAERIRQLIQDGVITAVKAGRDWLIDENQIAIVESLPDNRGKWKRNKPNVTERRQPA